MRFFPILTILFLFIITGKVAAQEETVYEEEVRGVWITNVDSAVLLSRENIAEAIDFLADNNFNVVYPVVWNKGFTQYPSQIMADKFGENFLIENIFRGRDPLGELIIEAHRRGLEVIPWFEFGFASSFSQGGGHIIQQNPEWAAINNQGNLVVRNGFDWMNGIHPEVQEFINSLIFEVIENYDVDGIQGDDRLPAMPVQGGYDEYTRQLYADEHDGAQPPNNQSDSDWIIWRAGKLTDYAEDLYNRVKDHDPNLIVSLSPSQFNWGLVNYLQHTSQWLQRGVADMVHPQLYRNTVSQYENELRAMVGPSPNVPGGYGGNFKEILSPGIIMKAGNQLTPYSVARGKILLNREYGVKGENFFFYDGLGPRNSNVGDSIGANLYRHPAILPAREGQLRRPPGILTNNSGSGVSTSGAWQPDFNAEGYSGFSIRAEASSNAEITYTKNVPATAHFHVYAFLPELSNATNSAHYTIFTADGDSAVVRIDQTKMEESGWAYLGSHELEGGEQEVVKISAGLTEDNRRTYADTIMLLIDRKNSPDVQFTVPVSVEDGQKVELPSEVKLYPNYPNPFNPSTTIRFSLDTATDVTLEVFDLLGRRVSVLEQRLLPAGMHERVWDAGNNASGMYIVRMDTGSEILTQKILLIK